jgi:DNA-binding phage protein
MEEANDPTIRRCCCPECHQHPQGSIAQQHRAINVLLLPLDERSRRLVAAFLASQRGHGGITLLAQITGLSRNTIRRGQRELAQPNTLDPSRIRRPGGGRKRVEKKMSRDPCRSGGSAA